MTAYEADHNVVEEPRYTADVGATHVQRFFVYRNQEVPHPISQPYDVFSLANTNAGNAGGVLYFMDGALVTQWTEVPVLDTKGYRKIVVRYYVEVQGPLGQCAACNYGYCGYSADSEKSDGGSKSGWRGRASAQAHPIGWVAAKGIGITKRSIREKMSVGTRYKAGGSREFSFPDEPKGQGQMCLEGEDFGTHGCSWKQIGLAKAVTAECVFSSVGKATRLLGANNGKISKVVRSIGETLGVTSQIKAEAAAFNA